MDAVYMYNLLTNQEIIIKSSIQHITIVDRIHSSQIIGQRLTCTDTGRRQENNLV